MKSLSHDEKVLELFQTALDVDPSRRAEFLARCSAGSTVVSEVRSLLAAHSDAQDNSFLAAPIFETPENARINQRIGHYRIVSKIGAGGMGVVYLAERADEEFKQKVAIKLIKGGYGLEEVIRRFRNERQILASLEHPNIARLIDGGTTDDGLPFLVMEYVEGVPVDEFAAAKNLSVDEKLELFRKICSAVAYAHRNLIIHRDLKSSNILVTADGEPKLLDFGIAKLFSPGNGKAETATNFRAFTPEYASPEQLRGEKLTTSTDIYSLGVILYELLTGARPFETEGKSFAEVLHLVSEVDPPRPSDAETKKHGYSERAEPHKIKQEETSERRFNNLQSGKAKRLKTEDLRLLRGDLDNIVLKSLRKEPERRYLSVEQFSEDIKRYQTGLPVTARSDTYSYRVQKFVQRNRIGVLAATLVVLAIVCGAAAAIWQARKAQTERARAERRFNDVRALVNMFLAELNDEMSKISGTTKARQMLVQRTLEYLDKASKESGDDMALLRELATAYNKIGDIQGNSYYPNLGNPTGALDSYQKALTLREQLAKENPSNIEIQRELAETYESIGDVVYDLGDVGGRFENYSRAARIVENLTAAAPENIDVKLYLAQVYASLADVKYKDGDLSLKDLPGALEEQRKALAIREPLAAANPEDRRINVYLNQSYFRHTVLFRVKGDFAGSFEYLRKSEAIVEKFLAREPENPTRRRDAAICYINFATHFIDAAEFEKAFEYMQKSLALREAVYNANKMEARAQRDLAFGYGVKGRLLTESGDAQGALESFRQQLKIYEDLSALSASNKNQQRNLIGSLISIGNAFLKTGDPASAFAHFNRAETISQTFPPDDLQIRSYLASIYQGIASVHLQNDKLPEAIDNFQKAALFRESEVEADNMNVITRAYLAEVYFETGSAYERLSTKDPAFRLDNLQAAQKFYQKSLDIWNTLQSQNAIRKIDAKKFEEASRRLLKVKGFLKTT